ncbi:MAG: GNAT family N-acetyltransferase [Akkermansiaceae bacterium]|nr:GNAT family N-acetyltransferase [Akkermansiaceae bacterium]
MNPEEQRLTLKLRDGTPVSARPLGPADREDLAEGYQQLSMESRYQRFWTRTGEVIGERMLDRLLNPDHGNHSIWAVLDASREYPGMGAASYWRFADDPGKAEFSCTVLDRDQGRGVGTLLLAILWLEAYANGIEEFVGYTMPENQQAIGWMLDTGGEGEWDGYKAIFRWDLTDTSKLPLTLAAGDLAEWIAELTPRFL